MRTDKKIELIKEAQKRLCEYPKDFAHDLTHHYRTWLLAKDISQNIEKQDI